MAVSLLHSDRRRQIENTDSGSALRTRITTKKVLFQHFSKKCPAFFLRRQIQDAFKKTNGEGRGRGSELVSSVTATTAHIIAARPREKFNSNGEEMKSKRGKKIYIYDRQK